MKLRSGFVSNSSSSSYIVYIPVNLKAEALSTEGLEGYVVNDFEQEIEDDGTSKEEVLQNLNAMLADLLNGRKLCREYGDFGSNYWQYLLELLDKNGMVAMRLDSGPDEDSIMSISDEEIENIVKLKEKFK